MEGYEEEVDEEGGDKVGAVRQALGLDIWVSQVLPFPGMGALAVHVNYQKGRDPTQPNPHTHPLC